MKANKKLQISALLLGMFLFCSPNIPAQTGTKADPGGPVFVIVHGAWGGGWAFRKVETLLRHEGCQVYRPTLTGQGEKVHLASPGIGLYTHVKDIVNVLLYEDLHDVILVGHSYGGMVITGVADSVPERIKKLIYLDAFLPVDGESLATISGTTPGMMEQMNPSGFIIPSWVRPDAAPPKDVPHPLKTVTDTLSLKNTVRLKIQAAYILTVAKDILPEKDDFYRMSVRAKNMGWKVSVLEADHNPQWSAPEALVRLLLEYK